MALVGRSGSDMGGLAPLSYGTIADWGRLMDHQPAPHEVEALMYLDGILRNPETGEEEG